MITVSMRRLLVGGFLSSIVLTGCVSQSRYDTLRAQNEQLWRQNAELNQKLSMEATQVGRLQSAIKYSVESDLLFQPGSWQLSENGMQILSSMARKLAPTQQNRLVVIGHTDNVPIGPGLREQGITSNLDLSQRRAEAVRDFLISQGVRPDLIAAVGHGDADPVASNDTPQGRSQNRRVELSLQG